MSKVDGVWSIATLPRGYTPKRQKTDPEVQIRLTYPQQEGMEDHMLHVLFLQTIMLSNQVSIRVLNKSGEALKEFAVANITKAAFYQNHFNPRIIADKGRIENKKGKVIIIHCICGIDNIGIIKKDKRGMTFLKQNLMPLMRHDWLEDDWNTRMIGFL
jgi:hypothetical protein